MRLSGFGVGIRLKFLKYSIEGYTPPAPTPPPHMLHSTGSFQRVVVCNFERLTDDMSGDSRAQRNTMSKGIYYTELVSCKRDQKRNRRKRAHVTSISSVGTRLG